jgi:hypothetical protein
LGLSKNSQGGQYYLLHDGRAGSIEEATLLHGGEAQQVKLNYQQLSEDNKARLIGFLSLIIVINDESKTILSKKLYGVYGCGRDVFIIYFLRIHSLYFGDTWKGWDYYKQETISNLVKKIMQLIVPLLLSAMTHCNIPFVFTGSVTTSILPYG